MTTIENDYLKVQIKSKGAEVCSIVHKENNLEYMWQADPLFWGKTSPILFPIVGALKNNTYLHKDKAYRLARHGFARDTDFVIHNQSNNRITFSLVNDAMTWEKYPFHFELLLSYSLIQNSLSVTYEVRNTCKGEMYFSLGAHPAFRVPLTGSSKYEDHFLEFNKKENADRWPITNEGLIGGSPVTMMENTHLLSLTRELFYADALVFKHLNSDKISIKSNRHPHGIDFSFKGFPFFGIWAARDANFVCLEPWCGIADPVTHDQQLTTKEGIERIDEGETWSREWTAKFY